MASRADEFDHAMRGDTRQTAPRTATGSGFDTAWQRAMSDERLRRAWTVGGPAAVVALAAATRLIGLDHPDTIVFDETYYVKDAFTLSQLGYESQWGEGANEAFAAGDTSGYTTSPSFVVHPPLGKWIIAGGMATFGTDSAFGWRVGIALTGIALVVLTMFAAHLLFRSTALTVIAGGLIAIDGNAIVLSRVSILDTALAFFALLGCVLVLLDRMWAQRRLPDWIASRTETSASTAWGPVFWWRPWLLAAAVAFGCATAVKWSGLYFLAAFGLYTVVSDAFMRKSAGIEFWATGSVLRQAPVNALLLLPLAALTHLATWWGWFATEGGYHRRWIESGGGTPWGGALAWVPYDLQNWWHFQTTVMNYHVGENTPHTYQANPLTWLFLIRPTSMFYESNPDGTAAAILDIANPILWWAATASLVYVVVRLVLRLRNGLPVTTEAFILTGMAAGYLPWLLYLNRTVFQFYTIAFEAFMVLALTAALAGIAGRRTDERTRRSAGLATVAVFLGIVVAVSAFFFPMWVGADVPVWFMQMHYWLGHSWI